MQRLSFGRYGPRQCRAGSWLVSGSGVCHCTAVAAEPGRCRLAPMSMLYKRRARWLGRQTAAVLGAQRSVGRGVEGRSLARRVLRSCPARKRDRNRPTRKLRTPETTYTYLASLQRAVRARRGDDARAERCLRVGCDKTALRSVLGFHVVDFPLVLPHRETSRPRPESTIWVITRQRWLLV